jgi:hypothetical protein
VAADRELWRPQVSALRAGRWCSLPCFALLRGDLAGPTWLVAAVAAAPPAPQSQLTDLKVPLADFREPLVGRLVPFTDQPG